MNELNRRRLLELGGAALIGAAIPGRLFAAPTSGARFLLVFLRGGYDSSNFLIPYSSSFYYEARPNIAIAKPDPMSNTSALALDADWALAPAVRESIGPLYLKRQVAFVPFAGTEDLSRSHFETQDSIELGPAAERLAQLSFGISRPSLGDLDRVRTLYLVDCLHRRLAAGFPGRRDSPQLVAQECG
jgi:uncharacterized protein (DUF1501 family)